MRRMFSALVGSVVIVTMAGMAYAQTTGTVTVTGTNTSKMTISIADTTAAYGAAMAPDGSGTAGEISSVVSGSGSQGAYYLWTPSTIPNITVRSNEVWDGTVSATENGGTSGTMTLASGALRYCTAAPATYAAAAACTALATTDSTWATNVAPGASTYTHYLALRVDWTDAPGTFSSTVTYAIAP